MTDKISQEVARRIYEDASIGMDYLAEIVNETTTGEYISKRYIREKLERVEYAVRSIALAIENKDE